MGHEGNMLVKKEDKRVERSPYHTTDNLFGGWNLRPTNHDGETLVTTGDKSISQLSHSHPVELAFTDSYLESIDESIEEILERLKNDEIYVIAIVGMGGSGKTTLAKEVGKKAKELNVFNLVVFINVSRRSNEKEIQDQIAKGLGLRWVTEDLRARARQIFERLQSEERILIILDDIWVRLDLQQIGIHSSENHKGCKVVLTTRYGSIVNMMDCQFLYHQYLLPEEGAWSLFCKWAGIENVSLDPNILALSRQLIKKCEGSPLAALLAGGCLRGKTVDEWVVAINITLQDSTRVRDCRPFIPLVKWSYEVGLSSKVAKSLLLVSGLFPENEILIEHLSHYAITLGLCGKNEVNATMNSLIYCGVLMHYDETKDHVIMHHLVREGARRIVEEENPAHRDNIREYLKALRYRGSLSNSDDFQWKEELDELLHQILHVRESTSNIVSFSSDVAVVAQCHKHSEPSGKLVDFKGLCLVDESYLPLLKEAYKRYPHIIECQAKNSQTANQFAFNILGQMLFMLNNASVPDWVYLKDELKIYWDLALHMQFDLEWLKPVVDTVLSSTEIHRIEALRMEEEKRNTEAAKLRQQLIDIEAKATQLRQQLNDVEAEATHFRTEIAQLESKFKLDGSAITDVSKAQVVSKVTPWRKIFRKRK